MKNIEAKKYFIDKNFITPKVLRYGFAGKYAYELSEGRGFNGKPVYGVTLYNTEAAAREYDKSGCFMSKAKAENHIASLTEEARG